MECKATNGVLHRSDDTVLNSLFINIWSTNLNRPTLQLLHNIGMYNYTPQVGYFNLATSQNGIQGPDESECLLIHENGTQENSTCHSNGIVNYICQSGECLSIKTISFGLRQKIYINWLWISGFNLTTFDQFSFKRDHFVRSDFSVSIRVLYCPPEIRS